MPTKVHAVARCGADGHQLAGMLAVGLDDCDVRDASGGESRMEVVQRGLVLDGESDGENALG